MALDSDTRAVLGQLDALGMVDFSELTPAEARRSSLAPPPAARAALAEAVRALETHIG